MMTDSIQGCGLGLRRKLVDEIKSRQPVGLEFLEITPENWMQTGGHFASQLRRLAPDYPLVAHGLSLSLGGTAPLDTAFIKKLKHFLDGYEVGCFSEHLSYCTDDGHLYDLLPIPFSEEAVDHVTQRILQTQELLQRRIAVENISYYAAPYQQMSEIEFINAVLDKADCDLLLDVNNVYVNSVNHGYDARDFIAALPAGRIAYLHIAGHYRESDKLIIDTHGAEVIDPVWALLDFTYRTLGVRPTLLERDFNLPPLDELLGEVDTIRYYQCLQHSHPARLRIA
jgi:uncharacterized protein (UPF0276 family)